METKNNEEMITVNGGCFPISWVRKFFNIETADIKDGAVTEAKLDPTLVSEIQQALKGLEITGDDSSGKITVTTTAGDSIDKALPVANAKQAGLMSGSDYAKVQQSVNNVDVSVGTGSGTITVTQNNGTSAKKTVPAATNSAAGLMSATDKTALGLSFSQGSKTADAEKVSLQLIKNDGNIAVVDIEKATETTAGVMSAEDKTKLDKSVKSITPASTAENVTLTTTNNTGGQSTVGLGAATTATAGVMTATDKQQLGNSVSELGLQQGASQVDISVTKTDGSHVTKTLPGATTDLAGMMTATDKANLNAAVKNVSGVLYGDKLETTYTKTDGSTVKLEVPAATTSAAGVMTAADKTNLENVKDINSKAIGNTPFIKNASSSGDIYFSAYTVDGTKQDVSKPLITIPLAKAYGGADYSGVMSGADKVKLDGIESGANKYVLPSATDTKIGGVKISSVSGSDTGTAVSQYGVSHILESYAKTAAVPSSGSVSPTATEASIEFNAGSTNLFKVSVPAATTSAAGVMTAADKQALTAATEIMYQSITNYLNDYLILCAYKDYAMSGTYSGISLNTVIPPVITFEALLFHLDSSYNAVQDGIIKATVCLSDNPCINWHAVSRFSEECKAATLTVAWNKRLRELLLKNWYGQYAGAVTFIVPTAHQSIVVPQTSWSTGSPTITASWTVPQSV
jgi:hypothetical protein